MKIVNNYYKLRFELTHVWPWSARK